MMCKEGSYEKPIVYNPFVAEKQIADLKYEKSLLNKELNTFMEETGELIVLMFEHNVSMPRSVWDQYDKVMDLLRHNDDFCNRLASVIVGDDDE